MEELSPDLFMKVLTYLPFKDVICLCQTKIKFYRYSTSSQYKTRWKALIRNTFGNVSGFEEKLERTWKGWGLKRVML